MKRRMAKHVEINVRQPTKSDIAPLVIDGEPFPFYIDKRHGVKVDSHDDNVHLVIVAIPVDGSVTITDHSAEIN